MKLLIVVHSQFELWNAPKWFGERLSQEFPQLQVRQRDSYDGLADELRDAEVIFSTSLRPEQFAIAQKPALDPCPLSGGT